jgi:glycogen synthase
MHVLMTADTVGGVWTYTRELVAGLLRRGHRVTLVSFGKLPCTFQITWMQGLSGLDFRPTPLALEWMQDSAEDIRLSTKYLEELIREVEPDLLHFNQYAYGAIKTPLPKIVVAHSDVVSWWMAVKGEEPPLNDWVKWYRDTVNAGLSDADEVVAPSRCMLENVKAHYVAPATASVIYNGRDASLFNGHSKKKDQVVSVGRVWDEAKQVSLLMNKRQAVPVFILGSQDHPDKTLTSFRAEDEPDGVIFGGQQSEQQIREVFARSSIYAGCSRYEPFGLALVEAAMSGCALIANDIPSFRELWGDCAYFFRRNDAESLAEGIRILSSDPELRHEYARRAHDHASENFSADGMVDSYEQLYGSLTVQEAAA